MSKQRIVLYIDLARGQVQIKTTPKPPLPLYEKALEIFESRAEGLLKELSSKNALDKELATTITFSLSRLISEVARETGMQFDWQVAQSQVEFNHLICPVPLAEQHKPVPLMIPGPKTSAPPVTLPPEASSATRRREVPDIRPKAPSIVGGKPVTLPGVLLTADWDFVATASLPPDRETPEALLFGNRVFLRRGRIVWDLKLDQKAGSARLVEGKPEEFETRRLYLEVDSQVVPASAPLGKNDEI